MTLKFICTNIRKSTKEHKSSWKTFTVKEKVGCSCLAERWDGDLRVTLSRKINYHASEESLTFLLPHSHRRAGSRISTVGRGFLMAGNFWPMKSGSTYELWVWVFSPIPIKMVFECFSWLLKVFFFIICVSVDSRIWLRYLWVHWSLRKRYVLVI